MNTQPTANPLGAGDATDDLAYVARLVANGGPDREGWETLNHWIDSVRRRRVAGEISDSDLNRIQGAFGESFSNVTMQGFAYNKPHGYAGDYEIIDRIYNYYVAPPPFSKWDEYWQAHSAAHAVRNRKDYFHTLLDQVTAHGEAVSVLKIASGPGRSMYEWMNRNPSRNVCFDCVEQDKNAIAYAARLNQAHADKVTFIQMNALKFKPEKVYDLVWAAGIFDYFADGTFVYLLSRLLTATRPGGELVIGNFSRKNPSAAYMELFEWKLHHRDAGELIHLAVEAGADPQCIRIDQEPEGVNLFLHIRR
jgi:SAM-dependent methyltransferase